MTPVFIAALLCLVAIYIMFAVVGEPQSSWLWRDVVGLPLPPLPMYDACK